MSKSLAVVRIGPDVEMSPWELMPLVGQLAEGSQPKERFNRVFEATTEGRCDVRAGVWEATPYAEQVDNYPYDEIVFVVSGSLSIIDQNGVEELFEPGDCFFLPRGFNGWWKQHDTVKIFHMTVAPI